MPRLEKLYIAGRRAKYAILFFGFAGITCSLAAMLSCEYFVILVSQYNDNLPYPFEDAARANVGLFKYQIITSFGEDAEDPNKNQVSTFKEGEQEDINGSALPTSAEQVIENPESRRLGHLLSEDQEENGANALDQGHMRLGDPTQIGERCIQYELGFRQFDLTFSLSQITSMIAPIFATVAVIWAISEMSWCYHKWSCVPVNVLFTIAILLQGLTLTFFGGETFCGSGMQCKAGRGLILSYMALCLFGLCFCIEATAPSAYPCCWKSSPVAAEEEEDEKGGIPTTIISHHQSSSWDAPETRRSRRSSIGSQKSTRRNSADSIKPLKGPTSPRGMRPVQGPSSPGSKKSTPGGERPRRGSSSQLPSKPPISDSTSQRPKRGLKSQTSDRSMNPSNRSVNKSVRSNWSNPSNRSVNKSVRSNWSKQSSGHTTSTSSRSSDLFSDEFRRPQPEKPTRLSKNF